MEAYDIQGADIVVNCTGYGALTLGGVEDARVYPTRGQTMLVRAPQVNRMISTSLSSGSYRPKGSTEDDGSVTYVIPRDDGIVVLGGTYQSNYGGLEVSEKSAEGILKRCIAVCPELVVDGKPPELVAHSVGLRPSREGGVRLEAQYEKTKSGREVLLVHNYGHGGFGYQSSWGCAVSVVDLVRKMKGMPVDEGVLDRFLEATLKPRANL
ncbi:hypothetical protein HK101_009724 [Irineochytrium annulatum]|nr:hypothetical protein HK101_009724 [Irineochytrium annulatum]